MIFVDLRGLKLPDIWLTGEEKKLTQETCPDGDRTRARCVTGAHATACSTAVDYVNIIIIIIPTWKQKTISNHFSNYIIT